MNTSKEIAKHLYEVYFGGNWTTTNLSDELTDLTWEEAVQEIEGFNTIATLAFHVNYFSQSVSEVLEGNPLTSKDEFSFNHPEINSQENWNQFLNSVLEDGKIFSNLIKELPDEKLYQPFVDDKYGNYYRNLHGIVEHIHYHLGQIVILKKLIRLNHA